MRSIPTFYAMKVAYGPAVVRAVAGGLPPIGIDDPLETILGASWSTNRVLIDFSKTDFSNFGIKFEKINLFNLRSIYQS